MIKIYNDPGEWLDFVKRKDNIDLTLTELKEKYRDEKFLFESTIKRRRQRRNRLAPKASGFDPKLIVGGDGAFAMRIEVPSSGFNFKVNLTKEGGATDYNIDWGDGNVEDGNGTPSHTYAAPGTYDIRIISDMDRIAQMSGGVSMLMSYAIIHILSWGNIQWSSTAMMFATCTQLISVPRKAPDLSNVTDMSQMFLYCQSFNQDLSHWNTSNVTVMDSVFNSCAAFDGKLSGWDTSKVENMSQMFTGCNVFNQNIGTWDTSSVTTMFQMFYNAFVFDSYLNDWDVGNVTTMDGIFGYAKKFNNGGYDGIRNWDITSLTSLKEVFTKAEMFNQPLDGWDTSNITTMTKMFLGASAFNQDISGWNISNVAITGGMFNGATSFSQNLGGWDIASLTQGSLMFFNSGMTTPNYDHLLVGWSTNSRLPNTIFQCDLKYSPAALSARTTLVNTPWTIFDGGAA